MKEGGGLYTLSSCSTHFNSAASSNVDSNSGREGEEESIGGMWRGVGWEGVIERGTGGVE